MRTAPKVTGAAGRVPNRWTARWLWGIAAAGTAAGVAGWAGGGNAAIFGLWAFVAAACALAVVLPLPLALVSPLYMGLAGWLVDMLPFMVLVGWSAVSIRWMAMLIRQRRLPRLGRWMWLPIALAGWTMLGVVFISAADFKHFLLLLGMQGVISITLLAAADTLTSLEQREIVATWLVGFVVILSMAVLLQWAGVDIESLQDSDTRERVEAYYGVDAFPNNIGMIKYARAVNSGALELRRKLEALARENPALPDFDAFRPKFQAFERSLVVRFNGSARPYERQLAGIGVRLRYDSVGLAPANTVPRLRSFPRNALTYAGVCAALFPFAVYLAWTGRGRRRLIGRLGIAACLFGAGFALARGAWVAIALGVVYLLIDGMLPRERKLKLVAIYLAGAAVLVAVYLLKYAADPLSARAGGGASVNTRADLYVDTVDDLLGVHLLVGFGTDKPRDPDGARAGTYIPRAGTHSTYLNYLFRTGLPGAIGIVAIYALAGLHARAAARSTHDRDRLWATLVAASVVIAGSHALILSLYVEPVYTLTIALLLGLAMAGNLGLETSILPWRGHKQRD